MGKRRTYEERWGQQWYRELKGTSKLFYDYLFDNVDWAGFIVYDMPKFMFETGLSEPHIEGAVKELISPYSAPWRGLLSIDDNKMLWMPDYCALQGNAPLNELNNAHKNIIRILRAYSHLPEVLQSEVFRGLEGANQPPSNVMSSKHTGSNNKDNDKKEADPFVDLYKKDFAKGLEIFPGTKRGLDVEYDYLRKTEKSWRDIVTTIAPAIKKQIAAKEKQSDDERDPWKHFKSWIYNKYWTLEIQVKKTSKVVEVG